MPENPYALLTIYIDGETKTGKGAAGHAMAEALKQYGLQVYYDVAGDFYRRFVIMVREQLGLHETDPLPTGPELEATVRQLYESGKAYERDMDFGDLQRSAVSDSVSILGRLPIAQQAGDGWWAKTLQMAYDARADVLVVDARNPRLKVHEANAKLQLPLQIKLDMYMTCEPEIAGRRMLAGRGVNDPTPEQVKIATEDVGNRRMQDRNRPVHPFIAPEIFVTFDPVRLTSQAIVQQSWQSHGDAELPVPIMLDNSRLAKSDMLVAVSDLAVAAVKFLA